MIDVDHLNTTYQDIITTFVLNTMLHYVDMLQIIETHEQLQYDMDKHNSEWMTGGPWHRWELPVLRYHIIRGNYHYPFLGIIFLVILHDFIRQNYQTNQSDRYTFFLVMVNYQIFLINDHILYFQMYYQYLLFLPKYLNTVSKKI